MKILFTDIDDTLTTTLSGEEHKSSATDVYPIPESTQALQHLKSQGWTILGVSNQKGVSLGHKTLARCIEEMKYTLTLIPELTCIYFCPDEGKTLIQVTPDKVTKFISENEGSRDYNFRKPNFGMITHVLKPITTHDLRCIMIGDRECDRLCASYASIPFIPVSEFQEMYLEL